MTSPHLNFPPSPTGVCGSSVTLTDVLCICTAIIMCSSLQDGQTSLMLASCNCHQEVVEILLSTGTKVDLLNKVSTTSPLQCDVVLWSRGICAHHCSGDYGRYLHLCGI